MPVNDTEEPVRPEHPEGRNFTGQNDTVETTPDSLNPFTQAMPGVQSPVSIPKGPPRGNEALIIKNTCRSGEVIRYPGDVVVFGDVNPGAEIIAGGDIMVLGTLRGMAHAGHDPNGPGNTKATIFALNLESHRLQIGPHAAPGRPEPVEGSRGAKKDKRGGLPGPTPDRLPAPAINFCGAL